MSLPPIQAAVLPWPVRTGEADAARSVRPHADDGQRTGVESDHSSLPPSPVRATDEHRDWHEWELPGRLWVALAEPAAPRLENLLRRGVVYETVVRSPADRLEQRIGMLLGGGSAVLRRLDEWA